MICFRCPTPQKSCDTWRAGFEKFRRVSNARCTPLPFLALVGSAPGLLLYGGRRVASVRIYQELGAKLLGVGQLAIIYIDGADEQPHRLRILDGQMPKSANPRDGDPFTRLCRTPLDPLVSGDASANSAGLPPQPRGRQARARRSSGLPKRTRQSRRFGYSHRTVLRGRPSPKPSNNTRNDHSRVKPGYPDPVACLHDRHPSDPTAATSPMAS
jgi:hypothetical protein